MRGLVPRTAFFFDQVKILVIDGDLQTRRRLRNCLERNGYDVVEAATGSEGIDETIRTRPHVVLLDLELPDIDGLIVLKRLREWGQVPVLVVSPCENQTGRIIAWDDSANGHLPEPFSASELVNTLQVAYHCGPVPVEKTGIFHYGNLEVDLAARVVLIEGRPVELTSTEYSLLALFIKHIGKALTHGYLLREIWGTTDAAKMGRLRICMAQLREKLEPEPSESELFFSETGIGYRLVLRGKKLNSFRHEFGNASAHREGLPIKRTAFNSMRHSI